jgi:dihydropteroate synthase
MSPLSWQIRDQIVQIRRPLVMGVVNVTPDSFSDGGQFFDHDAAVAHGRRLVSEGADLLDVGGESTRPGSEPVPVEEELRRVVPVVRRLASQVSVPISVDTSKAEVARQCLAGGACIINDVTALCGDVDMPAVVRAARAGVILMHMQGAPATMQNDPQYEDVVAEVYAFLEKRVWELSEMGLARDQIAVDPGIGFGKRHAHNLELLRDLSRFQQLGRPVCLGVSRKGFIGKITGRSVAQSIIGSVAVACDAASHGAAQILRVHDVGPTVEALKIVEAIRDGASAQL